MPIYNKFPRLYETGNENVTNNYYGGLNRPKPVGNLLGNQTAGGTGVSPQKSAGVSYAPGSGWTVNGQTYAGQDPRLWGNAGRNVLDVGAGGQYDPRYWMQTGERDMGDGNMQPTYEIRPEYASRLNGQIQLGQFGVGGHGEVRDPSQVNWDEDFGLITSRNNLAPPDEGNWLDRALPYLSMAAFAAPTALAAFGGGSAGAGGASTIPMVDTGLSGLFEAGGAEVAAGAGGTMAGPMTYTPPAGTLAAGTAFPEMVSATGSTGLSGFLNSPAGRLLGGALNFGLAGQNDRNVQGAADRADPFGPYRGQFAQRLINLYNDPSSIQNTPGYQFRRQQGEQGIERQAAQRGYFRSPNMLYNLSNFNQGLAEQAYNQEVQNLMGLSGANQGGATAGSLLAQGNQQSNSMRAGGINEILSGAGSIFDWLTKQQTA